MDFLMKMSCSTKICVTSAVRDLLSKAKSKKKHMMLGITGCEEKEKVQLEN